MTGAAGALVVARDAIAVLGRANLTSAGIAVDEPVEVVVHRSRHDIVETTGRAGQHYAVKLPGVDAGGSCEELRSEIAFYRSLTANPAFADVRSIAPAPVLLQDDPEVLVVDRVDGTLPFAPDTTACRPLDPAVVAALGRALAVVHAHRPTSPARPAWPRSLDDIRPDGAHGHRVERMLDAIGEHAARVLDELRQQPPHVTLVHGDVRAANILVRHDGGVVLIDWGRAGPDHPARDLAGALNALLQRQLGATSGDRRVMPTITAGALVGLRAEAGALWDSYAASVDHLAFAHRVVALATSLDIIQDALEAAAHATVTTAVARALQVACDLAEHPEAVLRTLFGI